MNRSPPATPGGMDDTVEPIGYRGEHRTDRDFIGDVGRHELEPGAEVLRRLGQVGADDRAAFGEQPPYGGEADARRGSGYDERSGSGSARRRAISPGSPLAIPRPYAGDHAHQWRVRLASSRRRTVSDKVMVTIRSSVPSAAVVPVSP